jgi:hypothetical protein
LGYEEKGGKKIMGAAHMRFLGTLRGVKLRDKYQIEKRDLLQTKNMIEEEKKYQSNWKQHVNKMQESRLAYLYKKFWEELIYFPLLRHRQRRKLKKI